MINKTLNTCKHDSNLGAIFLYYLFYRSYVAMLQVAYYTCLEPSNVSK